MALAGLEFEVLAPECDENIKPASPGDYCLELSRRKAMAGAEMIGRQDNSIVIGADTIVFHDGQILGKPQDEGQAFEMLRSLSGDTHEVYTGVTVITGSDKQISSVISFYEKTQVTFFDVSDDELRDYIKTGEPMDKAGAYGIQGKGCFLVEKINGDYFNVMGLPIARLVRVLKGRA